LLGEAEGSRAWLVSQATSTPFVIASFLGSGARGVEALSVTRPVPSFFVTTRVGDQRLSVVGAQGSFLSKPQTVLSSKDAARTWASRRSVGRGGLNVFDIRSQGTRLVFKNDASGLHLTREALTVSRIAQVPDGITQGDGWNFYEVWPR